ncbi:MAG: methionine synthase [Ruminococcus sp.]|nr:methionine synthase [Ruminococcus sp.]
MLSLDSINRAETLRYMGFGEGIPDSHFTERINAMEKELIKTAVPRFVWKSEPLVSDEDILSAGGIILAGNDIRAHLEGCTHVVFMAATLSIQTDMLISRTQTRNIGDAHILDALAGAGIEQICGKAEFLIKEQFPEKYMTWRYSAGYGDFPIELQSELAAYLDAQRKIGLTVTETSLMIPKKSVTAVIGIADKPLPQKRSGCTSCNMRDICNFRRNGVHCGNA